MGHGDPDIATLKTSLESVSSSLDDESLLEMYRQMVLSRTLDERVWLLNRQGKAAIVASSQGHEAAQIATVWAMRIESLLLRMDAGSGRDWNRRTTSTQ